MAVEEISTGFSLHPTNVVVFSPGYSGFHILPLGCLELEAFSSFSKVRFCASPHPPFPSLYLFIPLKLTFLPPHPTPLALIVLADWV